MATLTPARINSSPSTQCMEIYTDASISITANDQISTIQDLSLITDECRSLLFTEPFPSDRCSLGAYPEFRSSLPPDVIFLKEFQVIDANRTVKRNQRPFTAPPEIINFLAPISAYVSIAEAVDKLKPLWTDAECLGVSPKQVSPQFLLSL